MILLKDMQTKFSVNSLPLYFMYNSKQLIHDFHNQ